MNDRIRALATEGWQGSSIVLFSKYLAGCTSMRLTFPTLVTTTTFVRVVVQLKPSVADEAPSI